MIEFSNVFYKNKDAFKNDKIKYIVNQGGTSSTKTYSILQILVSLSIKYPLKIDIVGLSVPHLKSGVLNDMQTICRSLGFEFGSYYKEGDKVFKKGQGTINFLAFDKLGKAHGGRRDILYLNEANHLNWNIAEQLMIRTRKKVFIDYNPTNAFWVHKQLQVNEPESVMLIKSTYLDNPFLEESIIKAIESRKGDGNNNFWRVYGLGELGIAEGLVFNNFEMLDFDVNKFENYRNGIDWGFSNDPFAFTRNAIENDCLYICREIYQKSLLNKDSAPRVKEIVENELVRCDCAEPKSVAEYRELGVNAVSAKKGAGSIESGIKFMQSFKKIYIHPSCPNVYDEFCNYQWRVDKNGEAMPEPIDAFNHCLVGGTMILTDKGEKPIEQITTKDRVLTRKGFKKVLWAGVSDKNRDVYKVETDKGQYIIGTNNHKVLTSCGFCDIDKLRYGDTLLIRSKKCQNQLSHTTENGQDIQNQKDGVIENIIKAGVNIYITLFGKNLSGNAKKDLSFITKTETHKTMTFQTLKKYLQKNICKNTHFQKNVEKKQEKDLNKGITSGNGIQAKKVKNGIVNTLKMLILVILICPKLFVQTVKMNLNRKHITINSVQTNANLHIEENKELTTLLSVANGVEKNLLQANIQKQDFVVGHVVSVQYIGKAEKVYDITVDKQHEFFANGILVHNCIDSIRYSLVDDIAHNRVKAVVSLWD